MDKIKLTIYKIWYKYSHSLITAGFIIPACLLGFGLYALIYLAGYWLGREYNQAEMRYMALKKITRKDLRMLDALRKEAWDFDSLFNDLILPVILGSIILFLFNQM